MCQTDLTIWDASKEMHDQRFLHLPVKEDDGRVIGLVDVMDLVAHSAGGEGGKRWRDFFKGAMKVKEEKAISDTSSTFSRELPPQPKPIRAKYIVDTAASSDVFSLSLDQRASLPLPQKFPHVPGAGGSIGNNNALEFDLGICTSYGFMQIVWIQYGMKWRRSWNWI